MVAAVWLDKLQADLNEQTKSIEFSSTEYLLAVNSDVLVEICWSTSLLVDERLYTSLVERERERKDHQEQIYFQSGCYLLLLYSNTIGSLRQYCIMIFQSPP